MSQIALPLEIAIPGSGSGYLVTQSNALVHEQLQLSEHWPNRTAILVGESRSGKSAMKDSFLRDTVGLALDDADQEEDEFIFHLWNQAREERKPLLLVSSSPVSDWGVTLPDLQSRLASSLLLQIEPPDETMIEGLMQQYFVTRGLSISRDALDYLTKRMERSYLNVETLAQKMDKIAIERRKSITLAVAKSALLDLQAGS